MKMCNCGLVALLVAAWGLASPANAAIVASYEFEGAQNGVDTQPANTGTTTAPYLPTTVDANVTATRTTAPGAGGAGSATVRLGALATLGYPAAQGNVLLTSTQGLGDNNSLAHYFTVSITPHAGYSIDFQDLTLQAARGGGSARGFRVRSSVDAFTATLNGADTEALATQRPTLTNYTISLSSPAFDAITSPIEFRFYPFSTAPNNTIEMDHLVFNGTVALIPEASSLALVFAGLTMVSTRSQLGKLTTEQLFQSAEGCLKELVRRRAAISGDRGDELCVLQATDRLRNLCKAIKCLIRI